MAGGAFGGRRETREGRKGIRGYSDPIQCAETESVRCRSRCPVGHAQYALRRFVVHALDGKLCRAADYRRRRRLHLQEEHGQLFDAYRLGGGIPARFGGRYVAERRHGEHTRRTESRLPEVRRYPLRPKRYVYNNNARTNAAGGNDYYESAIVNPDLLLRDLVKIFHPELVEEDFVYYKQLK